MEYIRGITNFHEKHTCITLGKFDGLHLGHRMLLEQLKKYQKIGYRSIVFTFDSHPFCLFSKQDIPLIYTEEERKVLISKLDPDVMISFPFTKEIATIEPEDFLKDILIKQLDAKVLVVGSDFRFGHARRGDVEMLKKYETLYGYQLVVVEKLLNDGEIVSSTRIRKALEQGDLKQANKLLGNPYTIFGTVVHGRELGRTLGMPTVNLLPSKQKLLPPNGVYASSTIIKQKSYHGVTNIGCKPTVSTELVRGVETYLFDFQEQVYGEEIEVKLYSFERPEYQFQSVSELKLQIEKDVEFGKMFFKSGE